MATLVLQPSLDWNQMEQTFGSVGGVCLGTLAGSGPSASEQVPTILKNNPVSKTKSKPTKKSASKNKKVNISIAAPQLAEFSLLGQQILPSFPSSGSFTSVGGGTESLKAEGFRPTDMAKPNFMQSPFENCSSLSSLGPVTPPVDAGNQFFATASAPAPQTPQGELDGNIFDDIDIDRIFDSLDNDFTLDSADFSSLSSLEINQPTTAPVATISATNETPSTSLPVQTANQAPLRIDDILTDISPPANSTALPSSPINMWPSLPPPPPQKTPFAAQDIASRFHTAFTVASFNLYGCHPSSLPQDLYASLRALMLDMLHKYIK